MDALCTAIAGSSIVNQSEDGFDAHSICNAVRGKHEDAEGSAAVAPKMLADANMSNLVDILTACRPHLSSCRRCSKVQADSQED